MPYEHQKDLAAAMPEAKFDDAMEVMQAARLIKSAEEIAWFEKGADFTDRSVAAIAANLRAGMPEYELSHHIHNAILTDGGSLMFHFLGCTPMDAPEIIFPWQYPSTRIVQRGDILMTEISAGYWGYCGQIQRPFAVGAKPSPDYQRLYDLAAECYHRVFDAIRPGATDGDIRAAAAFIETSCRRGGSHFAPAPRGARRHSRPLVRLGNAAGLIDPQVTFLTMGQHPRLKYYEQEGCRMEIVNLSGVGQSIQAIAGGNCETSAVSPPAFLSFFPKNPPIDLVFPYCWLPQPHWAAAVKPDSAVK